MKIYILINFCTLSSVWLQFQGLKMGWEVKYHIRCQSKHGLSDSSVETGVKNMYFFGPKSKQKHYM